MSNEEFLKYEGKGSAFTVPEGTLRIGELAFSGADGLEKLCVPDSVREIGNYAFMNCYSLREIRMPDRLDRIGAGLFQNCWQIRKPRLPEGVVTLGTDMFENCHALTEIRLPHSLAKAARASLSGCRSLKAIHISPEQIELLPPSARYTAVLTFMNEHQDTGREAAGRDFDLIDSFASERRNSLLDLAVNRRITGAVRYMLSRGLIDEEALSEHLGRSASTGRVEITALLLDGLKDMNREDTLLDEPFI
jgi:hypothetical protein